MQHLISIHQLSVENIHSILTTAQHILDENLHLQNLKPTLKDHFIVNLFFEPSTRTRISFEVAAKRLGANIINFNLESSSLVKGESLLDTIKNLEAMGIDHFIIRHQLDNIFDALLPHLEPTSKIINAGNGCYAHPSQALLDMLTIKQHKKQFADLTVAIVGDIKHSRVAHSDITALQKLNAKEIRLVGPPEFLEELPGTVQFTDLNTGLDNADVIMLLRIQKERMATTQIPNLDDYLKTYGLTAQRLTDLKKDTIIMHPGPVNPNVEIAADIIHHKQSVILQQVTNGIAIRMAILMALNEIKF